MIAPGWSTVHESKAPRVAMLDNGRSPGVYRQSQHPGHPRGTWGVRPGVTTAAAITADDRPWRPLLVADRAAAAAAVARDVASRMQEPGRVEAALAAAKRQTAFPKSIHWQADGVAQGYAGLAVMCSYLDSCFPNEGWDVTGHGNLNLAARQAEDRVGLSPALFSGLSGLAFAAWQLSLHGSRYRRLIGAIDQVLVPQAIARASEVSERRDGLAFGQFDVISGLSGVAAYLLCRQAESEPLAGLRAILATLVVMTKEEEGIPRWHTPARFMADEVMRGLYPNGQFNCGLAHGIPGPLSLLALAYRSGVVVDGMACAIDRLANWLDRNRVDDAWGVNWPIAVPLEPGDAAVARPGPSRAAWCYGSPGVARALWLAGAALDHSGYRALAIAALEAVQRRPLHERHIDSPTFCHGVAGLLQITLRFVHDTGLAQFAEAARALCDQLLGLHEPASLLGYRDLEPGGGGVDQPGLLSGAPGVAMVLLAAATDVEPTWDRLFLLS
jgi:lantibiotic biosynthesis protein